MRMMANFNFSVAPGSDLIRSGKLNTSFERLMEDLKPEAAYFFTNRDGDRSGLVFFDLPESSNILNVVESFAFGLGARVTLTPVMSAEDIQKGFESLPAVIERFG